MSAVDCGFLENSAVITLSVRKRTPLDLTASIVKRELILARSQLFPLRSVRVVFRDMSSVRSVNAFSSGLVLESEALAVMTRYQR